MQTNALYYGDCLDWMKKWNDQSVDLIYLDPPFNSKQNYSQLFHADGGGDAQFRAFEDMWYWDAAAEKRWVDVQNTVSRKSRDAIIGLHKILGPCGMLSYLTYIAERLEHCHRLLKDTGSIYLHCDPTASHYLKIVCDDIFKKRKFLFRNEIIWHYYNGTSNIKHAYVRKHDTILFYSGKDAGQHYNEDEAREPYAENSNFVRNPQGYKDEYKPHPLGKRMHDVWRIPTINNMAKERLGYKTQKPEALLERIIRVSSNEGDIVLDPFCGCGTTVAVSNRLDRQFIGIDISSFAIDLIKEKRLADENIDTHGIPKDMISARKLSGDSPFNFESWAVTRLRGFAPNTQQRSDGGVDGRATITHMPEGVDSNLALSQVKGGKFKLSELRDFLHVVSRENATMGVFITLDTVTSRKAKKEVRDMGGISIEQEGSFPRVQLWSIEEYFDQRWPILPIMNDPYTGKPIPPQIF